VRFRRVRRAPSELVSLRPLRYKLSTAKATQRELAKLEHQTPVACAWIMEAKLQRARRRCSRLALLHLAALPARLRDRRSNQF